MVEIKICGFKRRKDIEDAICLGIRWIGLNFYEKSPRYINEKECEILIDGLGKNIKKIGVFVNPDERKLFQLINKLKIDGVQLHGNEPPSLIKKIKERFPEKIVIKAIRVKNKEDLKKKMKKYKMADFFLFDAFDEEKFGGTGKMINERLIDVKDILWERVFIAGGIKPENIGEIVKKYKPYGIDVASGVEIAPGIKDKEKMKKLIEEVKNVT